jgi:uncharacterized protein (DUF1501 family)
MPSPISRRQFLGGAAVLGGAAAAGAFGLTKLHDGGGSNHATASSPSSTAATRAGAGAGTLVLVTLYGGNDALNTVVPITDPQYASRRGDLALDPTQLHQLDSDFALHPALTGCKQLWDSKQLAIVHGVGFADLDRSHFHCMDVWQAGSEADHDSGWVGRWLDAHGKDPLAAVNVGRNLPLLMRGKKKSAAVVPASKFELPGNAALRTHLQALTKPGKDQPALAGDVATSTADLLAVVDQVGPIVSKDPTDQLEGETLGTRLQAVAAMIDAQLPTRVYSVDLSSFDTHANQAATHEALLKELDDALHTFVTAMQDRSVTVAVYSEFGRRVVPNASAGTDHGHGGVMLLAGNVRAGHHGDPPSLSKLDDGDLATTTDYRAVLGGLLEEVVGTDSTDIFGKGPKPLVLV